MSANWGNEFIDSLKAQKVEISKSDKFKKAMEDFVTSDKDANDYMSVFYVFHHVTKQGSGLLFSDIKEIIQKVLDD